MALDSRAPATEFGIGTRLDLETANAIAEGQQKLDPSPEVLDRADAAHSRLQQVISERRHVYGVTTGFGPLANRLVHPNEGVRLQQNLVNHLATGLGANFSWSVARAIVLARLVSILQGLSGASPQTIDFTRTVLEGRLAPAIPERGTVGASGDLTPLAHMVLVFQGQGHFIDRQGQLIEASEGLKQMGLAPLSLSARDGLALVNGTSAMTGVALRNALLAGRLTRWAIRLTGALAEVMGARVEAWAPEFARCRPHAGQVEATNALRAAVSGSTRLQNEPIASRFLAEEGFVVQENPGQDAYTLRCAPQVIGAVLDALSWHNAVVEQELNAVSDNPIFPDEGQIPALHGGNFMGQHVALVSDALSNALTVLAGLAERQVARLTDERLNAGLPAFLHRGAAGLHSGFMGAQVTATATLAEMRSIGPASVHSISTNGANQDVVSMGTVAARHAARQVLHTSEILAILALTVCQAVELRMLDNPDGFSQSARAICKRIRASSASLLQDRPLATDIEAVADVLRSLDAA
ncbi:MAG: aromatic amino acid ammonia-lyase [Pseudomonadota bacterium]